MLYYSLEFVKGVIRALVRSITGTSNVAGCSLPVILFNDQIDRWYGRYYPAGL